jgi:acyl dehydratase
MADMKRPVGGWSGIKRGRPTVGDAAERTRCVTSRDIERFAEMTGDRNPLHFDADLAAASIFGRIIVQGGVTSGLLNAVVAEDLPGPGSVFLSVEWKFVKAVGPGDTITARVEVLSVREDKPICQLATTVRNSEGDVCLSGNATTYTVPLPEPAF